MKKILFIFALLLATLPSPAQYGNLSHLTDEQLREQQNQEIREKIDLDYSVPDYSVKKPDTKVMGWRLAKMLQLLEKNYKQGVYNQMLSQIRNAQMEDQEVRYLPIDKIKILNIQKQDSVITIKISTLSKAKNEKVNFDITITFVNSVSDDATSNNLFCDIGRYIREDED